MSLTFGCVDEGTLHTFEFAVVGEEHVALSYQLVGSKLVEDSA